MVLLVGKAWGMLGSTFASILAFVLALGYMLHPVMWRSVGYHLLALT
jgi:hypothetical protein